MSLCSEYLSHEPSSLQIFLTLLTISFLSGTQTTTKTTTTRANYAQGGPTSKQKKKTKTTVGFFSETV